MSEVNGLGAAVTLDVTCVSADGAEPATRSVPTEVPFTILAGDLEIATMQCTPAHLTELTYGFLHAAGFISGAGDLRRCAIDAQRWVAQVELATVPDPEIIAKRIYTSGCGRGVTYASLSEAAARLPVRTQLQVTREQVVAAAQWLQHSSSLYKSTGGVHTAALSLGGRVPDEAIDDIGRHNAVDKVIGAGLMRGTDFSQAMLVSSGRISSEILHKARRCGVPVVLARGTPTHQTVLRARDMGITVIGRARGAAFVVYANAGRVQVARRG